jgi:hypothetical protein
MYLLRQYHETVDAFIGSRSRRAFVFAWLFFVAALAVFEGIFLWLGPLPINCCPGDNEIYLGGAWRIYNGQIPHLDFYNQYGDLAFYVPYLGMKMGQFGLTSIVYGDVIVMALAGVACLAILSRRTSAFYAAVFTLFLSLLAVAPRPLGLGWTSTCYGGIYNRYGEVVLALLALVLFIKPAASLKAGWIDGAELVFAGCCLALLIGCKLNYFVVGVGFFLVACLGGFLKIREAVVLLLGAAVFLALALALTGIPLAALYQDYRIMAAAQNMTTRLGMLARTFCKHIVLLPVLLVFAWEAGKTRMGRALPWRHFVVVGTLFAGGLTAISGNTLSGELPIAAVAALYCAEAIRRNNIEAAEESFFTSTRSVLSAILVAIFLAPISQLDVKVVFWGAYHGFMRHWTTIDEYRSTSLKDFHVFGWADHTTDLQPFMDFSNEVMAMLRRHADSRMRLAVFLYADPYNMALRLPPPKGGAGSYCWYGLNRRSHPPLKRMLGDATHLLVERSFLDTNNATAVSDWSVSPRDVYGPDWNAVHLEVVEKTKNSVLLRIINSGSDPEPH